MSTDLTFVKEVCKLFDITVLSDIEPLSDDENDTRHHPVFCLGWHGEPDAGIRYGTISPWFGSEVELNEFCERNIERFRQAAKDDEAAIPDASDWS